MNAVICRFSFRHHLGGVRAITNEQFRPWCVGAHNFSPFTIHALSSGVGTAVVSRRRAERRPARHANAEMAPFASAAGTSFSGRRCEQLQRLRHADRLVRREERRDRAVRSTTPARWLSCRQLREPQPAVLARDLDANAPSRAPWITIRGSRLAVDAVRATCSRSKRSSL